MKHIIVIIYTVIILSGCSVNYRPPQNEVMNYSIPHKSNQATILEKTKKVLIQEGFKIKSSDDAFGTVLTASKHWKLKPDQANCGRILALDYLHDPRTTTDVAFEVKVNNTNLSVRAIIQGQYKASALDEAMPLTCKSHSGAIEYSLASKILTL